ncbi:Valine--tRNA ligase, mitochondrial, variant 2 [Chamberlinius hualienensis]
MGCDNGKNFSMVLPPPNVTGDLHLGHALTVTVQDTIARWRRANGDRVLWVPGYDHAGIATQVVVEKKLRAETGRLRHQISREEFIKEANCWKDSKIENIRKQLQSLGATLDWSKECFTMDKNFEKSVIEAFVRLYEGGLIERHTRLVNWCCHLQSAVSDVEVENLSVNGGDKLKVPSSDVPVVVGRMIYLAYPVDGSLINEEVIVGTTRPETIFGDVAIAVHPNDSRFLHLIGKRVIHPFDGRLIPIIADFSVLPDFGSGCVKITPAHDYNDFEVAERHNLPMLTVMDAKGCLLTNIECYKGLSRFKARDLVISELKEKGLLRRQENVSTTVPVCSRTGDIIEPMLKPQWYLDCSHMFEKLIEDINSDAFKIQPSASKQSLLHWLNDKRKWCISRQLWWGHQIPAYKVISDSQNLDEVWVVGRTLDEAIKNGSKLLNRSLSPNELMRDEDVLDTWFSSALFPFATLGWLSNDDSSFQNFYPLSLMETGNDIIFFWVARMAIMGKMLTGKRPFSEVLAHGLICDAHGRKMSKSLGNVIDPRDIQKGVSLQSLFDRSESLCKQGYINAEELKTARKSLNKDYPLGIQRCGSDAMRFAFLSHDIKGQFINLSVSYVESCSPFCNKIWQTCRFYLLHSENLKVKKNLAEVETHLSLFDRWILSHLSAMIKECETGFENYEFHLVTSALRKFWVASVCDVYLEGIKPLLYSENSSVEAKEAVLTTLHTCIQMGVVALGPIMPFLAEELYQRLKLFGEEQPLSVSLVPYPLHNLWKKWSDNYLENAVEEILNVASLLRQLRVKYGISKQKPQVHITVKDNTLVDTFNQLQPQLEALGRCCILNISHETLSLSDAWIYRNINPDIQVAIDLLNLIDVNESRKRFEKEKMSIEKKLKDLHDDLSKPNYLSHAKHDIALQKVNSLKQKLAESENNILELNRRIAP